MVAGLVCWDGSPGSTVVLSLPPPIRRPVEQHLCAILYTAWNHVHYLSKCSWDGLTVIWNSILVGVPGSTHGANRYDCFQKHGRDSMGGLEALPFLPSLKATNVDLNLLSYMRYNLNHYKKALQNIRYNFSSKIL